MLQILKLHFFWKLIKKKTKNLMKGWILYESRRENVRVIVWGIMQENVRMRNFFPFCHFGTWSWSLFEMCKASKYFIVAITGQEGLSGCYSHLYGSPWNCSWDKHDLYSWLCKKPWYTQWAGSAVSTERNQGKFVKEK